MSVCGYCGFPIEGSPGRYFGSFVAHREDECRGRLKAEIGRLKAALSQLEPRAQFGDQCYQDACENAYTEASVVKRIKAERDSFNELVMDLDAVLLHELQYGRHGAHCSNDDQCMCDKHRLKRIACVRSRIQREARP